MRTSAEDSRVSDMWDSRKMMSSEQTETEVFGLFPKTRHLSLSSHALTIFCFLILNQVRKKVVFLQNRALHIISSTVVACYSQCTCSQRKGGEKWGQANFRVKKPYPSNITWTNCNTGYCNLAIRLCIPTSTFQKKFVLSHMRSRHLSSWLAPAAVCFLFPLFTST